MTAALKKILILGNQGYIGPVLARHLRATHPNATIIGYDTGYFASSLVTSSPMRGEAGRGATPAHENQLHNNLRPHPSPPPAGEGIDCVTRQIRGDVRDFDDALLDGVDGVVALAAISNDPMGNAFEKPTMAINAEALAAIAAKAKARGVRSFVFASSCSVYGAGGADAKTEDSSLNPLTAYARSKLACEAALQSLGTDDFAVTCLRFATACGFSPRLRLDLVLNDFVASALLNHHIQILSDGTPWRPLIEVRDMARSIDWSLTRAPSHGDPFLIMNAGSNAWNYTVRELAEAVARAIPGTRVEINRDAAPDKRSYRVDFRRFAALAPDHQPRQTLDSTIADLARQLESAGFVDNNFRNGELIRLNTLRRLQAQGRLDADLRWKSQA